MGFFCGCPASHSSISQLASSSSPSLAAHVWRASEHLELEMRSVSSLRTRGWVKLSLITRVD
eukprot:2278067-Prymnesium_polylepis.1